MSVLHRHGERRLSSSEAANIPAGRAEIADHKHSRRGSRRIGGKRIAGGSWAASVGSAGPPMGVLTCRDGEFDLGGTHSLQVQTFVSMHVQRGVSEMLHSVCDHAE
jgi:hypothetical protein